MNSNGESDGDDMVEDPNAATDADILGAEVIRAEVIDATVAASPTQSRPDRVWTVFAVVVSAVVASVILAGAAIGVALFVVSNGHLGSGVDIEDHLTAVIQKPWGVPVLLLPGQLAFLAVTLSAACLSPMTIRQRLDLKTGRMPKWTWLVMALATPISSLPVSLLLHFFPIELSDQLEMIGDILASQTGFSVFTTAILIAVIPAIVEEMLFRGYLQSRLLRRMPPAAAILISASIFAVAHVDPLHALGVFPLGIWLGIVAWRSGSILPAMLGHFVNNLLGFVGAQMADGVETQISASDIPILAVMGLLMIASLYLMFRRDPTGRVSSEGTDNKR